MTEVTQPMSLGGQDGVIKGGVLICARRLHGLVGHTPGFDAEQHYFSSANDCNVMTMAEQKNRLDNGYRYTLYSSKSPTIMGKKSRDSDGDVAARGCLLISPFSH
ncbi:hypothetical protein Tco_1389226 [Tanacetum coccineum]